MKGFKLLILLTIFSSIVCLPQIGLSAEYLVYGMYKPVDLGIPGEVPQRDYYINMGSAQGISPGSILQVHRRISTYDLESQKLYKDITFPIATLKVIHVESGAAVARLDKYSSPEKTPVSSTKSIIVGDIVRASK